MAFDLRFPDTQDFLLYLNNHPLTAPKGPENDQRINVIVAKYFANQDFMKTQIPTKVTLLIADMENELGLGHSLQPTINCMISALEDLGFNRPIGEVRTVVLAPIEGLVEKTDWNKRGTIKRYIHSLDTLFTCESADALLLFLKTDPNMKYFDEDIMKHIAESLAHTEICFNTLESELLMYLSKNKKFLNSPLGMRQLDFTGFFEAFVNYFNTK